MQWSPVFLSVVFSVILLFLLIAFVRTQELPSRVVRWGLFVSSVLLLARGIAYSIVQYQAFRTGLFKLLPTGDLFLYTMRYSLLHYFSSVILSALVGGALLVVFGVLQKRSHGKWLDTNERLLVFFGVLAAGWPGAILYAIGVFILPLLATPWLAQSVTVRRVRLAPFIILSALLAIAFTPIILPHAPWLEVLVCRTCI